MAYGQSGWPDFRARPYLVGWLMESCCSLWHAIQRGGGRPTGVGPGTCLPFVLVGKFIVMRLGRSVVGLVLVQVLVWHAMPARRRPGHNEENRCFASIVMQRLGGGSWWPIMKYSFTQQAEAEAEQRPLSNTSAQIPVQLPKTQTHRHEN